ncbi:hypothetical protein LTR66_006877 [Elasticomyces elasticus]|nr:hypothetical protein LTR66_006877 [Elasticomyces elasticus]
MSYYPPPSGPPGPYQGCKHSLGDTAAHALAKANLYGPYVDNQQAPYSTPPPPTHNSPYQQQIYSQAPPPMQNQGYHPQTYGQPQQPYPPQGHSSYPPPSGHSPYPTPQQGFTAPSGPPPQHQGYGAPPPGQFGQQPPPGAYGGPPQQQWGQPPQPLSGAQPHFSQPTPPSMGYIAGQVAQMDMSRAADELRSAMKGIGTNEKKLIDTLVRLDPLQIAGVKQAFYQRHKRNLLADIESETSGYFRDGLAAIVRGPLEQDVYNLNRAIAGLGTKENLLNDVLLGRSNADLNAIKAHYHHTYRRTLESDVKGDLSLKTERLFDMVLAARRNEESAPVIPQQTEADVQEMYRATEGSKVGTDQVAVCSILSSRSDGQIRAIAQQYHARYRRTLASVLEKNFSGHMEDVLLFMLGSAEDKAKHDASQLEAAMKGMGTKDDLLVNRVVRIHWDRTRMQQCKGAYRHFYKQELYKRIQGETRGDYERLMVACVEA